MDSFSWIFSKSPNPEFPANIARDENPLLESRALAGVSVQASGRSGIRLG